MLTTVLKRYQEYDLESGQFGYKRSLREYARLLGVSHATLSVVYSGQREPSIDVLLALAQKFPGAAKEIAAALSTNTPAIEQEQVPA